MTTGDDKYVRCKTGVVGRVCEEVARMGTDKLMVFHCSIQEEEICCKMFAGDERNGGYCDLNIRPHLTQLSVPTLA